MLDFGALPPEINSARMYCGPGSAPMMAAAAAWDALSAQLEWYATGYSSTLAELQGHWSGGSSMTMASAVAPYVAWATTAAAQAEQAAGQARAAAAAHEMAFAATVPPPMVAANRLRLTTLVATNFFGQNTPAIAATEAEYAAMWARDAAAMYGYAAASSAASVLTPFSEPPRTTNSGGQSAQTAMVNQAAGTSTRQTRATMSRMSRLTAALPQQLQTLAAGTSTNAAADPPAAATATPIVDAFAVFNTLVTYPLEPAWSIPYTIFQAGHFGTGSYLLNIQRAKASASQASASQADVAGSPGGRGPVLASVGKAAPVGKLSVPQSWVAGDADADCTPTALPDKSFRGFQAVPAAANANPAPHALGAIGPAGTHRQSMGSVVLRNGRRRFTMPRPPYGG